MFSLHHDTLAPDMLSTPFVGDQFGPHTFFLPGSLRTGLIPEVFYGRNEPALIQHPAEVERALGESPPERFSQGGSR